MRHGRAKAARKTLKYFERTVNLKNKPYYSVLMDATFLTAMLRITTVNSTSSSDNDNNNNTNNSNSNVDTIAGRIERVLQVNGGGGGSSFSGPRDDRLVHVDGSGGGGGYNDHDQSHSNGNSNGSSHHHNHFNARYFIPQEAVDELEMIIQSFIDRAELTSKRKKKNEYKLKSKVFEDALDWINANSSKRKSHRGSGRCEVLPKFTEIVSTEQYQQQQQEETEQDENVKAEPTISAMDAVRRHIARDDGREEEQNQNDNNNANNHNYNNKPVTRTYIVASQEDNLLDELRALGTVPILRCTNNASVLILENPSKRGQRTDQGNEKHKWNCSLQNPAEKALVDAAWKAQRRKQKEGREHNVTGGRNGGGRENNNNNSTSNNKNDKKKRGVSGPKGPNPLSCKRKRSSSDGKKQGGETVSKSKKRRERAQRKNNDKEENVATTSGGDKNGDEKSS